MRPLAERRIASWLALPAMTGGTQRVTAPVDRMFTVLVQRAFTKAFDGCGAMTAAACVSQARNAD